MRENRDKRFLLTVGIFLVVSVLLVFLARIKAADLFRLPTTTWDAFGATASYQTLSQSKDAEREREIVAKALRDVEAVFDGSRADSLVRQVNETASMDGSFVQVRATSDLMHVLVFAMRAARNTKGAFDPTIAPLLDLWADACPPPQDEVDRVKKLIGWRHIRISMEGPFARIALDEPGVKIDLWQLARGYAVDLAYVRLKEAGAARFKVRVGDTVRVSGNRYKNRKGWMVSLRDPAVQGPSVLEGAVPLQDGEAFCVMGADERLASLPDPFRPRGLDPRTGAAIRGERPTVCVVARNALAASGYAAGVYVMGRENGETFARREHSILRLLYPDKGPRRP